MGGQPYAYVVDYEQPLQAALDRLRARELEAGRYYPVVMFPQDDATASPGKGHATIAQAMKAAAETGTRSILDIARIAEAPDYCVAAPFSPDELEEWFGSTRPDASSLERPPPEAFDAIDRGMARYVVGYERGAPTKILFLGYSFD